MERQNFISVLTELEVHYMVSNFIRDTNPNGSI